MSFRSSGILLAFATILLQIAVHLQPLLPEKYHIAPVCLSITHHLLSPDDLHSLHAHEHFVHDDAHQFPALHELFKYHHDHVHDEHNHQCQYCTVYGDLVLPPEFGVKEVFDRIQVRLYAYSNAHKHVYFELQRLFLIPQGRAPPTFSA